MKNQYQTVFDIGFMTYHYNLQYSKIKYKEQNDMDNFKLVNDINNGDFIQCFMINIVREEEGD